MDETDEANVFADENERASTVFTDRTGTNAGMAADVTAAIKDELVTFPTTTAGPEAQSGIVTTLAENSSADTLLDDLTDDEIDFVDAILQSPEDLRQDAEVAAAFSEILRENGFSDEQIADVIAGDAQLPDILAAQSTEDAETPAPAVTTTGADDTDEEPTVVVDDVVDDGTPVDPDLIENAGEMAGVEAQSGVVDDGADGCPAMMATGDDSDDDGENDATGADMAATDDAGVPTDDPNEQDMAACNNPCGTGGADGLTPLGEVVQMFQMLAMENGAVTDAGYQPSPAACEAIMAGMMAMMDTMRDGDTNNADDMEADGFC